MTNLMLAAYFNNPHPPHYIGLHVTDPTNAGLASTEISSVTTPTYHRQMVTWSTPANRAVTNTNKIQWTALPRTEIGYLGIWDAATNGNMLAVMVCRQVLQVANAGSGIYCPPGSLAVVMGGSPEQRVAQLTALIANGSVIPTTPIPAATPGGPTSTLATS